eukprot:scaffold3058_cov65-Phaeocystis_antarctica.AAC.6
MAILTMARLGSRPGGARPHARPALGRRLPRRGHVPRRARAARRRCGHAHGSGDGHVQAGGGRRRRRRRLVLT